MTITMISIDQLRFLEILKEKFKRIEDVRQVSQL